MCVVHSLLFPCCAVCFRAGLERVEASLSLRRKHLNVVEDTVLAFCDLFMS